MANLVALEQVSLTLGTHTILDGVSLGITGGARIGVVGRNGGGKSTLLRVLAGDQEANSGRVTRVGMLSVGLLRQVDTIDPESS